MFLVLGIGFSGEKREKFLRSMQGISDVKIFLADSMNGISENDFDLIILDIIDHKKDILLNEILHIKSRYEDVPLILWGDQNTSSQIITDVLEAGISQFWPWPMDSSLLLSNVKCVLRDRENYRRLVREKELLVNLVRDTERLLDKSNSELAQKQHELYCLYQIATLREKPDITLEEITQGIADIIPSATQSRDKICVRIILGYNEFKSKNFRFTPWRYISDVIINGEWGGSIEVYYFSKPETFSEKNLIDAVSERLGRIAERFRTEESLQLESRNIKNILSSVRDLIYKVNEDYEIEYINPALEKEFGPVMGKKCYKYFGKDKVCEDCNLNDVLRKKTLRREWYFENRRKIYDVLDTSIRNPDGTISKLSILRDLTELKRAHRDIREREQLYRTLTESVADGVVLVRNGKISFVNSAFAKIFEFDNPESTIGLNIKNLFDQDFHPMCEKIFDPFFISSTNNHIESMSWLLGVTNKGKKIWVSINRNVISLKGRLAILATIRDVTEQVLWEKKMQEETEYFRKENIRLKSTIKERYRFGDIIGKSQAMQEIYELILKAANSDASVVILGESGTGKELVARAIHRLSSRSDKPFVVVNCGAIPEQLAESEFFGHRKGAFTGAHADKHGYLHVANQGTLFLDEVGELGINIQVKFLRALETGEYSPVGDTRTYTSDFRLISATNKDLSQLVSNGKIREDFYYRISVIPIYIPPLRERKEDIPLLVEHFLKIYGKGKYPSTLPSRYMDLLMNYDWPGNARELQGMIQRYLTTGNFEFLGGSSSEILEETEDISAQNLRQAVSEFEKKIILKTLHKNKWHRGKSASKLGIDPKTLYRKMRRYGIFD